MSLSVEHTQDGTRIMLNSLDSFNCKRTLDVNGKSFTYYSLTEAEKKRLGWHFQFAIFFEGFVRKPASL